MIQIVIMKNLTFKMIGSVQCVGALMCVITRMTGVYLFDDK